MGGIVRKTIVAMTAVAILGTGLVVAPAATAAPPVAPKSADEIPPDNLPNPLDAKRSELRESAIVGVLNGDLTPEQKGDSTVVKVGTEQTSSANGDTAARSKSKSHTKSQYVELSRETTDRIFVVLAEFGDQPSPYEPAENAQRTEGPLHNEIPKPNRKDDNSTVWNPDYSQSYFQKLYFEGD